MPHYRRNYVTGGTYFFTLVTLERRPLFAAQDCCELFLKCYEQVQATMPFQTIAWSLLPDHYHAIWVLPSGDSDYSTRWRRIKSEFTKGFLAAGGLEGIQSPSRAKANERGVWQRRFWEYTIRDEADLERCVDYIHCNPFHHGLVERLQDWKWSSFQDYVKRGQYPEDWQGPMNASNSPVALWGEY